MMKYLIFLFLLAQFYQHIDSSLPLYIKSGKFKMVQPQWIEFQRKNLAPKYQLRYFIPSKFWNQIFYFCPKPDSKEQNQLEFILASRSSKPYDCDIAPQPVVKKVTNPNEMKKKWDDNIEWYASGYKFEWKKATDNFLIPYIKVTMKPSSKPQLKFDLPEEEDFVYALSAFYDKTIKQIRAVQYHLLHSPFYEGEPLSLPPSAYVKSSAIDLNNMESFLERTHITSQVFINDKSKENPSPHELDSIPLASPSHFITQLMKRMSYVRMNVTTIQHELGYQRLKIDNFLTEVAQKLGKLRITSGVTGLGLLDEESNNRIVIRKSNGAKIINPDYVWKAVELKLEDKIFGIILVIDNSLTETKEKLCEVDLCEQRSWDMKDKEIPESVHCCDMTQDIIKKLDVDFLELEERLPFSLKDLHFYDKKP